MKPLDGAILSALFVALVVLAICAGVSLGAVIFMWAWNLFMPIVWPAAPKLGFWAGVGAVMLISFLKGIFQITEKKD